MSTYINDQPRLRRQGEPKPVNWTTDLVRRLRWLYGDAYDRMGSPEAQADLLAWRNLGRR